MRTWITLSIAASLFACTSKSPFTTSPASLAVREPCRFMGTLHKESRQRLESLRACHEVSMEEWSCMISALKQIDTDYTLLCREGPVSYDEIADRQRAEYAACAIEMYTDTIECALLSEGEECLASVCE